GHHLFLIGGLWGVYPPIGGLWQKVRRSRGVYPPVGGRRGVERSENSPIFFNNVVNKKMSYTNPKVQEFLNILHQQQAAVDDLSEQIGQILAQQSQSTTTQYGEHLERLNKSAEERIAEANQRAYELLQERENWQK